MTPVIGITTYEDQASWRGWSARAAMLPYVYVEAVRRSGGRAVMLPPGGDDEEASATVAGLDGLLVTGGPDIDPVRYGAARHPRTQAPATLRDAWDLAVTGHALRLGVPLLAICRGMQVLNVCRGGTLHQHLPDLVGHGRHDGPPNGFGLHHVRISPDSTLAAILTQSPRTASSTCPRTITRRSTCSVTASRRWPGKKTARSRRSRPGRPNSAGSPASCSACSGTLSRAATPACSPRSSVLPTTVLPATVRPTAGPPATGRAGPAAAERDAARSTVLAPVI